MTSTIHYNPLPDRQTLQQICKGIAVLDAILCPDWEFRYYSFNSAWAPGETFFEMRDGQGDHLLILFRADGCVVNGFQHDFLQTDKQRLTHGLPSRYKEFIFGEPVNSIGTTFCTWTNDMGVWTNTQINDHEQHAAELLHIFNGNPQTYIDWAREYHEDACAASGIPVAVVREIYGGITLTKEMVLAVADDCEDWEQLQADLDEIGYPYNFAD